MIVPVEGEKMLENGVQSMNVPVQEYSTALMEEDVTEIQPRGDPKISPRLRSEDQHALSQNRGGGGAS